MKKINLMMIIMTLFVSFLFLFSIQFSGAHITIIAPLNTSNISSGNGSLVFFNITYVNATDLQDPFNATIYLINSSGSSQVLGNISCIRDQTAGSQGCEGSLNITKNQSGASIDDGVYTLNVTLANNTARNVTQNWSKGIQNMTDNITIDNTPPKVTDFNISLSKDSLTSITGKNGLNFTSQIIFLNVTVNDTNQKFYNYTAGNVFVFFNFTNSAGTTNISLNGSNPIGDRWNASVNTSFIIDGHYNVTVWANDSHNIWNSSTQRLDFTVDTTVPAITLTQEDTLTTKSTMVIDVAISDTVGIPGGCVVDRTDSVVTGAGTLTQVVTENNLNCGISYVYKVACTDALGLSFETAATTFATDSCSSSGGSGGGGSSSSSTVKVITSGSVANVKEDQIESSSGYRAKFQKDAAISFEITPSEGTAIETHKLTVTRVGSNSVTIIIASDPITLSVNVGEEKKVDVDGDGVFDLSVRLNAISSGRADISVEKIEVASDTGEAVSEGDEISLGDRIKGAGDESEESEGKNLTVLWIILVVIIVAIVVAIIYQKKKK
jgi:hypothetical protein